jgi:hypothetical protein
VRWYITYRLSYRNLVEMMAERGIAAAQALFRNALTSTLSTSNLRPGTYCDQLHLRGYRLRVLFS